MYYDKKEFRMAKAKKRIAVSKIMTEGGAHNRRYPYYCPMYMGHAAYLLQSGAVLLDCRGIIDVLRIQWGKKFVGDQNLGVYYAAKCIALFPEVFKGKFRDTQYKFEPIELDELAKKYF